MTRLLTRLPELPRRFFTANGNGSGAHFRSRDPDATWTHMQSVFSSHRLTVVGDRKGFSAQVQARALGGLTLSTLAFGTAVELDQEPSRDFLLVSTQIAGRAEVIAGDQAFDGGPGLVMVDSPHLPVRKRFSADSRRIHLRFDTQRVEAACAKLLGRSLDAPLHFAPFIDHQRPAHAHWLALLQLLLSYVEHEPECSPQRLAPMMAHVEEAALLMLLTEHDHNYSGALRAPASTPAPRHVRRAEEYLRDHADEPLTLADVAAAAGVSVRTLSQGFRDFRATSVMQYLQEVRLERVREDLLAAEPEGNVATIATIALRWGFNHLGRFAQIYRRRYGELPSETLRA